MTDAAAAPDPTSDPVEFVAATDARRFPATPRWRVRHVASPAERDDPAAEPEAGSLRPGLVVTVDDAARVLWAVGDLDMAARVRVAAAAASVGDRGDVTVDLAGVRFVDAAGLGTLIVLANQLARAGHRLRLRRPVERVRRVFGIAGLATMLQPEP